MAYDQKLVNLRSRANVLTSRINPNISIGYRRYAGVTVGSDGVQAPAEIATDWEDVGTAVGMRSLRVRESKLSVLGNGIDLDVYPFRAQKDDFLVYIGRANPDKLPALLDENPSYVFFREVPAPPPGTLGFFCSCSIAASSSMSCSLSRTLRIASVNTSSSRRRLARSRVGRSVAASTTRWLVWSTVSSSVRVPPANCSVAPGSTS